MILGAIAIAGIHIIQLFLLKQAFRQEENKFRQKVHVALMEVVKKLYTDSKHELPQLNPVKEVSEDYYVVNVNQEFNADVLEFYLKTELTKFDLVNDFEYAIYNCETDGMVYGNYISFKDNNKVSTTKYFPRQANLVYYFAIHFPQKNQSIYASLQLWIIFSVVMFFVLIIYSYSVFTLLQQKKYANLQKDFINNMTHEFKTPLSSILLSSQYLIQQPVIQDEPKLNKYTGIIIQQANKLNEHVEKLLDLAKTESDSFSMKLETIHPETVIRDIMENIQLRHQHANIILRSSLGNKTIQADPFHFSNIIYNLLDNSIKYSKSDPVINISLEQNNKSIQMIFSDKGMGIPAKDLDKIFDKFYRVQGNRSTVVKGFGLGLFYIKKICLAHRWKISANSVENEGTSITIQIPQ